MNLAGKTPTSQLKASWEYRKRLAEKETSEMKKERSYQSSFRAARSFIKKLELMI